MNLAYWISTLFKSGLARKAPGTIGTLVSLILWGPLVLVNTPEYTRILLTIALFFIGIWSVQKSLKYFKGADPQSIVIDEAAGLGLTLCLCSGAWINIVVGFCLFRLFDICKPWPVSWADRKVKGALGIMLDDLFAGVYALICLYIFDLWILPALGSV